MPFNGTGVFNLAQPAFTPNTTISSSSVNSDLSDIATNGLTKCVTVDGQNTITGQLKFPNGTAAAPAVTFANDLTTGMYYVGTKKLGFSAGGIAAAFIDQNNVGVGQSGAQFYYANGAVLTPVGTVIDFAGASIPSGWILCFGQNLAQASYPELFVALGTTWGSPGGGNFTLPDLRGRVSAGRDDMGGVTAGRITNAGSGIVGTLLGTSGGAQNILLSATDIPALTTGNNSVTPTGTYSTGTISGSGATGSVVISTNTTNTFDVSLASTTHTHSIPNGAPTRPIVMQPTAIMNKIIFAGRP